MKYNVSYKIISGFRWAEAADLANNRALSLSLPRDHRRKEPLGQANTNPPSRLPESQKYSFFYYLMY